MTVNGTSIDAYTVAVNAEELERANLVMVKMIKECEALRESNESLRHQLEVALREVRNG